MDLFTKLKLKNQWLLLNDMSITNFTVSLKSGDHYMEVFKHTDFQEVKNFRDKLSQSLWKRTCSGSLILNFWELKRWCPGEDLNLHAEALDPKSSVSTNFTTWALRKSLVAYFHTN